MTPSDHRLTPLALAAVLAMLLVGLTGCPGTLDNADEFDRGEVTNPTDTDDPADTATDADTTPGDTNGDDTTSPGDTSTDTDDDTAMPSCNLATIQEDIFVPSCGNNMVCHGTFAANGLNLTEPGVESRVFGATSTCNGRPLAVAGDPEGSFFFEKIIEVEPECGSQMPIGVDLTPDEIDCIRTWIEAQP